MQLSVHAYASGTRGCRPLNAEIDAGICGRKWSERGQRGACAMVQNGDADVANCGSVPLNTVINSSLNRTRLSTSSPQPSVFQTLSSGSSTGPERITKSSSRYCFSMKRLTFLTHVAHRTLSLCSRILIVIWAIIGMSGVANLAISSGVGRWSINWRSISHTLVFFRIIRRTRP